MKITFIFLKHGLLKCFYKPIDNAGSTKAFVIITLQMHSNVFRSVFLKHYQKKNISIFICLIMQNGHVNLTDTCSHITFPSYPQLHRLVNPKEWLRSSYEADYINISKGYSNPFLLLYSKISSLCCLMR